MHFICLQLLKKSRKAASCSANCRAEQLLRGICTAPAPVLDCVCCAVYFWPFLHSLGVGWCWSVLMHTGGGVSEHDPSLSRHAHRRCCVTKISIKYPRWSERDWCRRPRRARLARVTSQRGHLWSVCGWGENSWMCGETPEAPGSYFTRWWEVDCVPVCPCELR